MKRVDVQKRKNVLLKLSDVQFKGNQNLSHQNSHTLSLSPKYRIIELQRLAALHHRF